MGILRRIAALSAGGVLLFFSSCMKDYDQYTYKVADWEPLMAVPLVTASLGMEDIVKNAGGYVASDSNSGLVHLVYESDLISANAKEYLVIPDQELATVLNFAMPGLLPGDTMVLDFGDPVEFNLPGEEIIDSLQINGLFKINLVSDVNHSGKIHVELPFVQCNGQALTLELVHSYTGTLPVVINEVIDLSGCTIYITQDTSSTNIIQPRYRMELYGDSDPAPGTFTIEMNDKLEQLDFISVFGRLGSYSESLRDIFDIGLFGQVDIGEVELEEINLDIEIENSFGLPIQIVPKEIWATSSVNPPYKVTINDLPSSIDINAPDISAVGSFAQSAVSISSSDIVEAFRMAPQLVYYDFSATLNPPGFSGYNFILDTSEIRFKFRVDIPLKGKVGGLELQDTVNISLDNIKEAKTLSLRLMVENYFPIEVDFQAYMVDSLNMITDSLFNEMTTVLPPGIPGPGVNSKVASPGRKLVDIVLNEGRLGHFLNTKSLIIRGRLRTHGSEKVSIYDDYEINLKVGASAGIQIRLDD